MERKKLVPKRRFAGFDGQWKEQKLKDFRDESDRYSYTGGPFGSDLKSEDYTESGVRIIQLQNIGDGFFSNGYKIYTSKEKAQLLWTNLIYPREIIIAKMAEPLARAAIVPDYEEKYLMASDGIRLKVDLNKFNSYFILTLINNERFRKKALENSTGTTRKRIGLVTLGNLSSYVPEYDEQQKIGQFFKQLDEMIALQQRKLEKTKALKSAYLAEMFPAEGEKVPKRRFAGFMDAWEQCKVKDLSEKTFGGGTPKTSIEKYWNGEIPWIQSSDLHEHQVSGVIAKKRITEEGLKNSATKLVPKNSISIVTRVGVGKIALMPFKYATSQDFVSLGNLNVDKWFGVYSLYKLLQKEINSVQGTSIKGITKNELLNKQKNIPNGLEEQHKIGNFFKQLDDMITNHRRKLDKLKAIKQAYLHEMFV